jgi:hypothetical protein
MKNEHNSKIISSFVKDASEVLSVTSHCDLKDESEIQLFSILKDSHYLQ